MLIIIILIIIFPIPVYRCTIHHWLTDFSPSYKLSFKLMWNRNQGEIELLAFDFVWVFKIFFVAFCLLFHVSFFVWFLFFWVFFFVGEKGGGMGEWGNVIVVVSLIYKKLPVFYSFFDTKKLQIFFCHPSSFTTPFKLLKVDCHVKQDSFTLTSIHNALFIIQTYLLK